MIFGSRYVKTCLLQSRNIPFCWQRIPDAGNPRQQTFKAWNCSLTSCQVAQLQSSFRELIRGLSEIWKDLG
jgi:hypothetical protein